MYHLIVNEESGNKRGGKKLLKAHAHFTAKGVEFQVHRTEGQGDAERFARELTSKGENVNLIAVGGDGTFHEVLNGIADFENTTLGFIPAGRGNDFARAAKIKRDVIKAAESILRGEVTPVDYIEIDGKRSLNFAGTGLDVEVLEEVLRRKKTGKLSYIFTLMKTLRHFHPYKVTVTVGDEAFNREAIMIGVGNGGYFGGGINISPYSDIADGKMNLIIINMVKRWRIPLMFIGFLKGRHIKPKTKFYAEHIVCDEVKIVNETDVKLQLDGEIYSDLNFNAKIVKGALKIFRP